MSGKRRKPRGGAKGKSGPPRPPFQASTRQTHQSLSSSAPKTFSLKETARNTERAHIPGWSSGTDTKLRHKAISFVSAGTFRDPELDQVLPDPSPIPQDELSRLNLDASHISRPNENEVPFMIDTIGVKEHGETGLPSPRIRTLSPVPSDSSEEVVIFQGRVSRPRVVEDHTCGKHTHEPEIVNVPSGLSHDKIDLTPTPRQTISSRTVVGEDSAMADYLDNIVEHGETSMNSQPGSQSNLGDQQSNTGSECHKSVKAGPSASAEDVTRRTRGINDWDSADLEDFNVLSTSDELLSEVGQIISKRYRPGGAQYLVVYDDTSVDEARWISRAMLIEEGYVGLIDQFENSWNEDTLEASDIDSTDSSDEDDRVEDMEDSDDGDDETEEEQDDLGMGGMSDSHIARMLSKQEELGFGSDQLLLWDDIGATVNHQKPSSKKHQRGKKNAATKTSKRPKGEFPAAELFAEVLEQDPYNGFEIMDFERPSLKKKAKGRHGVMPFELSDEELQQNMERAWQADREKKKAKKAEREELRVKGLLGRNRSETGDLRQKYKDGMDMKQIVEEMRVFMSSNDQSCSFPPMEKDARARVHRIASAYKLTSVSRGSGKSRFTTLTKNQRTISVSDPIFRSKETRFLNRLSRINTKAPKGGGNATRAGYRDGQIVGESAPEIGVENRGRAMLEKMGWTQGTALGATNNKGILLPVSHVVKNSKVGLG